MLLNGVDGDHELTGDGLIRRPAASILSTSSWPAHLAGLGPGRELSPGARRKARRLRRWQLAGFCRGGVRRGQETLMLEAFMAVFQAVSSWGVVP